MPGNGGALMPIASNQQNKTSFGVNAVRER